MRFILGVLLMERSGTLVWFFLLNFDKGVGGMSSCIKVILFGGEGVMAS